MAAQSAGTGMPCLRAAFAFSRLRTNPPHDDVNSLTMQPNHHSTRIRMVGTLKTGLLPRLSTTFISYYGGPMIHWILIMSAPGCGRKEVSCSYFRRIWSDRSRYIRATIKGRSLPHADTNFPLPVEEDTWAVCNTLYEAFGQDLSSYCPVRRCTYLVPTWSYPAA
jgi:hypothetical protein